MIIQKPLKVKYSSGWILVTKDQSKILAHASTFPEIIKKADKVGDKDSVIMAAAKSYRHHLL